MKRSGPGEAGSGLESVGDTATMTYFSAGPRILLAVPFPGARDTKDTARENIRFQERWWVERGDRGVCIVQLGGLADVSPGARAVYSTRSDPAWSLGIALIVDSMLTRAIASFFLGISRPRVPTQAFADLPSALDWAEARVADDVATVNG